MRAISLFGAGLLTCAIALPVAAQSGRVISAGPDDTDQDDPRPAPTPTPATRPGEIARSPVGQAGQRQTREDIGRDAQIKPMARIVSRIQNRVQSRIRNRIDRFYDPRATATSPFTIASDQVRTPRSR